MRSLILSIPVWHWLRCNDVWEVYRLRHIQQSSLEKESFLFAESCFVVLSCWAQESSLCEKSLLRNITQEKIELRPKCVLHSFHFSFLVWSWPAIDSLRLLSLASQIKKKHYCKGERKACQMKVLSYSEAAHMLNTFLDCDQCCSENKVPLSHLLLKWLNSLQRCTKPFEFKYLIN